jgi:hypothetical protein
MPPFAPFSIDIGRSPSTDSSRYSYNSKWPLQLTLQVARAAERPFGPGAAQVLAAWRVLFAAACLVRLMTWWQLPLELQVTRSCSLGVWSPCVWID